MSLDHEYPNSSEVGEPFAQHVTSSKKYKRLEFHDVRRDLHIWKKESTCRSCWITFESWEALHNHKCQPHRCETCSSAFEHDFMLIMHQCHSDSSGKSSQKSLPCDKNKQCINCEKQLPVRARSDFCRKCRFLLEKDQKYSLRRNSSSKLEAAETEVKENGNGLHSLTDNEDTDDKKGSELNHVDSYSSRMLSKLKRKRDSLDSIAENSSKRKTFEPSAADSLAHSDTSLDNLDVKCDFRNRFPKKNIEVNLKNSLVTVLRKSSEKKRADQSSTSKKNLGKNSKTSILDSSCNGIQSGDIKVTKKHVSNSSLFKLEKTFAVVSSAGAKRNFKRADLDSPSECNGPKSCKETLASIERAEVKSAKKTDQSLTPVRKSKRKLASRKISVNSSPVGEKKSNQRAEELNVPVAKSGEHTTDSGKIILEPVEKKSHAIESVECLPVANKGEKTSLKSSKENAKEIAIKKSPRLNSVRKSLLPGNKKGLDVEDSFSSVESVQSSVRKSRRNVQKEESVEEGNLGKEVSLQQNEKTKSVVQNEKCYPAPVSPRNVKSAKSSKKKDNENAHNENSAVENSLAVDSDATSSSSTSSAKHKRGSLRKNLRDSSSSPAQIRNMSSDKASNSAEISISASQSTKSAAKVQKNEPSHNVVGHILTSEKDKMDSAQDVETSGSETESKASKSKIKDVGNIQKEISQSKKQVSKTTSVKSSKTYDSSSITTRRGSLGSKQSSSCTKPSTGNKVNASVRSSHSNIDYTPELEVSESTLNSIPDVFSSPSPACSSTSDRSATIKSSKISSSENDTIKLESLFNVLPDSKSGVLLRVISNTSDNYRCLKCNKLFKTIKMASTHYGNCKTHRVKRTAVLLRDIIWICVQCNYHCYQMSELNFHRQSCAKPSNNVSLDNCIRNYDNTCHYYCPKCSYHCISPITFNSHPCEQRVEQMSKCIIGVKKLSLKDISIQKYECTYCESTFLNLKAYQKHVAKHTVSPDPRTRAIKQEPGDASGYIKSLLAPLYSKQVSEFNSRMQENERASPHGAPGLAFEREPDTQSIPREVETVMSFLPNDANGCLDLDSLQSQVSKETWHSCLRDYNCRCKKHENATEAKPCLACLNTYIRNRVSLSLASVDSRSKVTQTDPPLLEDATVTAPTCVSDIPTLTSVDGMSAANLAADNSVGSSAQSFANHGSNSSSLDAAELSSIPIHIASVSSCNEHMSGPITCTDTASISNIPALPPDEIMQNDRLPGLGPNDNFCPQVSTDCRKSELYIRLILILKGNFVNSMYTTEKHNNLVKSIYKLKFNKLAEPHQVAPDRYYLLTEFIHRSGDESSKHLSECMNSESSKLAYDESGLQNYFLIDRPFTELMPLFMSQEPCDFDVVLCDNGHHFIHLSWQFAPDICYSAYCVKSDSEPTGIKFICGHCFDHVSIHLLIEHFDIVHEGAYHYNILIS